MGHIFDKEAADAVEAVGYVAPTMTTNRYGTAVDPTDFTDRTMRCGTAFKAVVGVQYELSGKRPYGVVAEAVLAALEPYIRAREAKAFEEGLLQGIASEINLSNPYTEES